MTDYLEHIDIRPNYPEPGVNFVDLNRMLANGAILKSAIDDMVALYEEEGVTIFAGFESRGLGFAMAMATATGAGFVPLRKAGNLPGDVISRTYQREYGGLATIEMQRGLVAPGDRVALVDDVAATGGTIGAGVEIFKEAGATVVGAAAFAELDFLHARERLAKAGIDLRSVIHFNE